MFLFLFQFSLESTITTTKTKSSTSNEIFVHHIYTKKKIFSFQFHHHHCCCYFLSTKFNVSPILIWFLFFSYFSKKLYSSSSSSIPLIECLSTQREWHFRKSLSLLLAISFFVCVFSIQFLLRAFFQFFQFSSFVNDRFFLPSSIDQSIKSTYCVCVDDWNFFFLLLLKWLLMNPHLVN